MTEQTKTAAEADKSFADKAKEAAATAQGKVTAAAGATVEAAKEHPYAAAGIVAGVAAAVAGAVVGATKLREGSDKDKSNA